MTKLQMVIKNIECVVTGDISNPILEADTIVVENGRISKLGRYNDISKTDAATVIDANGLIACPGLIDAHTHPAICDYLPDYKAVDWVAGYVNGGVTSMISAGEISLPVSPNTVSGAKALAILAKNTWDYNRPCGAKVHAGALMLEQGLEDNDFRELVKENIKVIGEIGMSRVQDPEEVYCMVKTARSYGFKSLVHAGGASKLDCASYTAEDILKINPDVVCHLNGAPTPMSVEDTRQIVKGSSCAYDLVSSGNIKMMLNILKWSMEENKLDKIMLGSNVPSSAGYSPLGCWMLMAAMCVSSDLQPAQAVAMATGNVANIYNLDHGLLKEGYQADILLCDTGSSKKNMLETIKVGRVPAVAMVIIDGNISLLSCKQTAPPARKPIISRNKSVEN